MNEQKENKKIIARIKNLARQRKEILSLPPEKALDAILDSSQSAALVHSLSEEDFHFLIHDIGIEDALPLLRLASDKQWEYIVDLEIWEKDRIDLTSVTKWFDLLFKIDPGRFIKWFLHQKTELMEYYLFKNIEIRIRETDEDPSDFGEAFFSFDDTFYVKFLEEPFDLESDLSDGEKTTQNHRDDFLSKFLETLSAYDHLTYQKVLLEASGVIPAETEEEAYRLKNVRLAEKGFLPYAEAVGIYQPMKVEDFKKQPTKFIVSEPERKLFFPVPFYHTGLLDQEDYFTTALKKIEIDDVLEQIQIEFASLCNLIISADQKKIREKEQLKSVVKKACGYINIGLEKLTEDDGDMDADRCAAVIQRCPLSNIFKVGFGLALELKWRAEKWQEKSWFKRNGLLLGFWDQDWMGVLGGLLIKKPLFYDNYKTGVLYREFVTLQDIKDTENTLNEIVAFDEILSLMNIEPEPVSEGYLTYKNFVLTLWARNYMGLSEELLPLPLDAFKNFFNDLWTGKDKPRKTRRSMKESFLDWLSDKTGFTHYEITQKLGQPLENLFNEIESEVGEVSRKDLDPRYINLFFVNDHS
jgi:hypothetical protein